MTDERARGVTQALLIIDIQNDYFPGGAYPLEGAAAAVERARTLLERFRRSDGPVVHLRHRSDAPEATFMRPGTPGAEIHDLVEPLAAEPVVEKRFPNGFRCTRLKAVLDELGASQLVVAGMMSSMCVDATVRAADDLGFAVIVAHDACAAPSLEFEGRDVAASDVHAAFMAALADGYATVLSTEEVLSGAVVDLGERTHDGGVGTGGEQA